MPPLFQIAAGNLLRSGKRTALLGGAIACVTALLIMVMGTTSGIQKTIFESATTLVSGHVNVGGFYKASAGNAAALIVDAEEIERQVREEVPGLRHISRRERGWARLISDSASTQLTIVGVDIANEPGLRGVLRIYEGSIDALAERDGLLLFRSQTEKLGASLGDRVIITSLTARGINNTVDTRVVAVAEDIGAVSSMGVFLNSAAVRELYNYQPSATGVLQLFLDDPTTYEDVQARLRERLAGAGHEILEDDQEDYYIKAERVKREAWVGQKLDVTTWEDEIWIVGQLIGALDGLVGVLIFVLLAVISVGVMNSLWVAVRERRQEIGTLRALGMHRRWVVVMVMSEAALLGLSSTALGATIGSGICLGLNALKLSVPPSVQVFVMRESLHFAIEPGHAALAVGLITACTVSVSVLPSFLAARLRPVTAMHSIG